MPKLSPKSGREVLKILEDNGFRRITQNPTGSHIRMGKNFPDGTYRATTVQMNRREIEVWVIHKIIRQTGKPAEEFV